MRILVALAGWNERYVFKAHDDFFGFLQDYFIFCFSFCGEIFYWFFFYGVVFFDDVYMASVYYVFLNFLIFPVAVIVIFMALGIKQERSLYVSAFMVVALSEVLEVVVSFSFFEERVVFPLALLEYLAYAISVIVGVRVGERIGRRGAPRNSRG